MNARQKAKKLKEENRKLRDANAKLEVTHRSRMFVEHCEKQYVEPITLRVQHRAPPCCVERIPFYKERILPGKIAEAIVKELLFKETMDGGGILVESEIMIMQNPAWVKEVEDARESLHQTEAE